MRRCPMPESHVPRWEPLHPVIDELRARPGDWAILYEVGNYPEGWSETKTACLRHRRVEVVTMTDGLNQIIGARARWIPDYEWWPSHGRNDV